MTARFNFIIDCTDSALTEYLHINEENAAAIFTRGDLNWCLQTYHILAKRNNLPVQCSNRLEKNCINIIHSDQILALRGNPGEFVVCVRADYPRRMWTHYHLVQNKNQLTANTSYIPHWVQPGLIKRDPNRQGVERVAYAGEPYNGNLAGTSDTWKTLFEPHGIEFSTLSYGAWHDLSKVDVLVGIRSFDDQPHNNKPPTKLFSAWHANIPFIGGHDSAFKQVGKPGEDYLLAGTPQEVLEAVLKLRNDPNLYHKLVQNGARKAAEYTEQSIAETWENVLTHKVLPRYQQWKDRPLYERVRYTTLLSIGVLNHNFKQMAKKLIRNK